MADILKDRIPPHNDDAERAVLGAMLLEVEAVDTAGTKLTERDFYSKSHALIFSVILSLSGSNVNADLLTLREELRKRKQLDAVGGDAYIAGLTNVVPTTANIEYYCKVVSDCALRRELIRMAYDTISAAFDDSNDARETLEKTEQRIFDLDNNRHVKTYRNAEKIIPDLLDKLQANMDRKGGLSGIPSGLNGLDKITDGFQRQDLIIIGARPSEGKTALALTMAKHIAVHQKKPCAFFTLEMPDVQLMMRLLSGESLVNSNALRTGNIEQKHLAKIYDAAGLIHAAPLYVVDEPNMKLLDLRSQARRLVRLEKVEIIFIDYLGLIGLDSSWALPRHEMIAEISRSLKSLARELNIPIIVLSQLNRPPADGSKAESKPGLSRLRDSGAVEQDADLVMFIHRKAEDEKKAADEGLDGIPTTLVIAKHRNGPTEDVPIMFKKTFTLFTDVEQQ